jgi:putative acetyltransferase
MNIKIRNETAADAPAIKAVTIAAFMNAPRAVIGHVAVSPVSISNGASGWFGLGPISVLPEHQRRRVGSRLMHEALRILREHGAGGCVVLGEPEYCSRFGFQADPNLILPDVPPEYFQAISLDSSRPHGTVSYHQAFNARE